MLVYLLLGSNYRTSFGFGFHTEYRSAGFALNFLIKFLGFYNCHKVDKDIIFLNSNSKFAAFNLKFIVHLCMFPVSLSSILKIYVGLYAYVYKLAYKINFVSYLN